MLICTKENCKQKTKYENRYMGETERSLNDRISEHIRYINKKKYSAVNQQENTSFNLASWTPEIRCEVTHPRKSTVL